ncbi:MAG: hypothetical protein ABSF94_01825 [Steroidobacteraceae bacterium]
MTSGRVLVLLPLLALVGGCSWHRIAHPFKANCHAPQPYQHAVQVAPLHVPSGMDSPNVQSALVIPAIDVSGPPPGPNDPCLDAPPRYKATPPAKSLGEEAAGEVKPAEVK